MKNTRLTLIAALLLAATSVAHAQAPIDPAANPAAAGATAPTADTGTVSNAQATTTTTTTTSAPGIGADGVSVDVDPATTMESSDTTQLANTGGEPVLMSLVGLSMALGAFAIRKRVSA